MCHSSPRAASGVSGRKPTYTRSSGLEQWTLQFGSETTFHPLTLEQVGDGLRAVAVEQLLALSERGERFVGARKGVVAVSVTSSKPFVDLRSFRTPVRCHGRRRGLQSVADGVRLPWANWLRIRPASAADAASKGE